MSNKTNLHQPLVLKRCKEQIDVKEEDAMEDMYHSHKYIQ